MKLSFKLKESELDNPTSIQFKFYKNKKRFVYSLGHDRLIKPSEWNFTTERPKDKKSNVNIRIENIISRTNEYETIQEKLKLPFEFEELKVRLNELSDVKAIVKEVESLETMTFDKYLKEFIISLENETRKKKDQKPYSKQTATSYKLVETILTSFKESKNIKHLHFHHFNKSFYNSLLAYMYEKKYSTNYFGKIIKNIKSVLQQSFEDGEHTELAYKNYLAPQEESDNVALSQEEVMKIYNFNLSGRKELELSRDIFIVQCFTALRVSDALRIKPEYIITDADGTQFLKLWTTKLPSKEVVIPLSIQVKQILEKYNNSIPKTYEQKINYDIKEICQLVGIDTQTEIRTNEGGLTVKKTVAKYNLIKSHTGRRTAATNMFKAKLDPLEIIKITGHSDTKMLMRYLKIDVQENARIISSNQFFNTPNLRVVND